jgi:MFS family permease
VNDGAAIARLGRTTDIDGGTRGLSPASALSRRTETVVLLILSLVNGIVALDRLAVNFLSPFIVADLGLSNTQLGLLSSALSGAISVSGLLFSAWADRTGRHKGVLIWVLVAFSLLSGGAGVAMGFATLFLARFLLGVTEGPLVPLTQTIMGVCSHPARRGFNMGAMQIGGAFLIGAMAGPVVAVFFAERIGWQATFFMTAIPGLVSALLVALFVPMPGARAGSAAPAAATPREPPPSMAALLRSPNLLVCMAFAALFTGWLTIQNVFMPRYLVETMHYAPGAMSWMLSLSGAGGLIGGILIPALSDRFGRRPLAIFGGFFSVVVPVALLTVADQPILLGLCLVIGGLTVGCAPLVLAIIPSESVAPSRVATAVAMSFSSAELFGGMGSPPIAGWMADQWGLRTPFYLDIALAIACGLLALALRETAPKR